MAALASCAYPPSERPRYPELADNLPLGFAEADAEFKRRVNAAFPLPIRVDDLAERLTQQGFFVDRGAQQARFAVTRFPCQLRWLVGWNETGGDVSRLLPVFGRACL